MKTESELYDEFFTWLDNKIKPIKIPKMFPESDGLVLTASDFLAGLQIKEGSDYYCDVLFELWKKHTYDDIS